MYAPALHGLDTQTYARRVAKAAYRPPLDENLPKALKNIIMRYSLF